MTKPGFKILCAVLITAATAASPAAAKHLRYHKAPRAIDTAPTARFSYSHNYGPGYWPGEIATYDGPLGALCAQSAAAYRGQNGRTHPCF